MTAADLAKACQKERENGVRYPANLRTKCYRKHWEIIRDAVRVHGAPLLTAIRIFREDYAKQNEGEDPFENRDNKTVWIAYNRAMKALDSK